MKPFGLTRSQRNRHPTTLQPPYAKALLGLALALAMGAPVLAETLDFSQCVDLA